MDISKSYKGQRVLGKTFSGVGVITNFWLSEDIVRCYVDVDLEDGTAFLCPLDLCIPVDKIEDLTDSEKQKLYTPL